MTASPAPIPPVEAPGARCRNCGAPMLGDYCHACGQPQRGRVRPFASLVDDFVDSVLNLDNRLWRTLLPLYFGPGRLTVDYLDGRRMRYVAPLRLYLTLSVLAFLVIAAATDAGARRVTVDGASPDRPLVTITPEAASIGPDRNAPLDEAGYRRALDELERGLAEVPAAVRGVVRDAARVELERRRALAPAPPATAHTGPAADAGVRTAQPDGAGANPQAPAASPGAAGVGVRADGGDGVHFDFGSGPWDPVTNPLRIAWLPEAINDALNAEIALMRDNAARVRDRPDLILRKALSLAPTALLLVLPLVAVLLKLAYLGRRRLYVEHLIFALHSHSFLCLSLIVAVGLNWLATHAAGHPWIAGPAATLAAAAWAWVPLYLLLMLKRAYAQGWAVTLFKAALLGAAYLVLLSFGFVATFIASLIVL